MNEYPEMFRIVIVKKFMHLSTYSCHRCMDRVAIFADDPKQNSHRSLNELRL